MNYDFAKQLKEAGFPQPLTKVENPRFVRLTDSPNEPFVVIPTLFELIEACGKHFHSLTQQSIKKGEPNWRIKGGQVPYKINEPENWGYSLTGNTPEEAVANLWLALNDKRKQ